ncbi:hypothetical protein Tco_0788453 [Tanacetum coccineum]
MVPPNNLGPNLNGKAVNETQYRGMIGSLIYLTTSRLDIQFSTCLCARYQANPKESHLIAVKRISRYLKDTPSLGLWYPKCSGFDLKGYSDSDYTGCNMDRKNTSGACQFLGGKLVYWSAKKKQYVALSLAEAEYVAAAGCCANILWMKSQLTDYDIIYEKIKKLSPVRPRIKAQAILQLPHMWLLKCIKSPTSLGVTYEEELTLSSVVGMDEGTQNYSLDHIFVGTNTSVLVDKTKSAKNGLKTTHTDLGSLASILEAKDKVAKLKAKVKVAFLKAQPLYPDVNQLTELLFLGLPSKISSVQEKLKTFDILSSLLNKVTNTLNRFATSMENASSKITDKSIPLASQANASPAEREKNTNDADNANLKKQPTTTNPPTTSFQSPLFPKSKGKEVMSSKDAEEEETKSDSNYDHANPADSMVESSKQKKLNKFSLSLKVVNKFILLLRRLKNKRGLKNLSNMSWPNKK